MDVIIAYLDTMFSPYPATPRLEEAKAELRAMMEDKYSELLASGRSHNEAVGQVITEFGNLDELASVLGIAAELQGGVTPTAGQAGDPATTTAAGQPGAMTATAAVAQTSTNATGTTPRPSAAPFHPMVTLEEAQAFADARHRTRWPLAIAVALLVVSPATLIALSQLSGGALPSLTSPAASAIGVTVLLVLVALGVSVLIRRSQQLAPFKRLEKGEFTRTPAVSAWAQDLDTRTASTRTTALIIAVILWILSAVPVIVFGLLTDGQSARADASSGIGVALTLVIVAIGLLVFLPHSWAHSVAEVLSDTGTSASGQPSKTESPAVGTFAAVYWPLLTAIFLACGLIWDAWDRAWVIWPVGALVFGAIAGGLGAWDSARRR